MYFPSPSLTLNISNSLSTYIVSEFLSSEFQLSMCVFSILKACMLACLLAIASYSICYAHAMHAALLILRIANTTWVSTTLTALLYPSQSTTQRMRKLVQTSLTYSKHTTHTHTYEEWISEWMRMNEWERYMLEYEIALLLAFILPCTFNMHNNTQCVREKEREKEWSECAVKWGYFNLTQSSLSPHRQHTDISSSFTRESVQLPPLSQQQLSHLHHHQHHHQHHHLTLPSSTTNTTILPHHTSRAHHYYRFTTIDVMIVMWNQKHDSHSGSLAALPPRIRAFSPLFFSAQSYRYTWELQTHTFYSMCVFSLKTSYRYIHLTTCEYACNLFATHTITVAWAAVMPLMKSIMLALQTH
jgi:hypothetical protein